MDPSELNFLQDLTKILEFSPEKLQNSLNSLCVFSNEHSTVIKLFEYINPVKLFYKQSASSVKLLILRNKNRLIKELQESGELLVLLSQSTLRDLNTEEKNKVKEQFQPLMKIGSIKRSEIYSNHTLKFFTRSRATITSCSL
jgi:hypothetical protein